MIKPKSFLCFGLGILSAIAMGIGCAQENHDARFVQNPIRAAQPEEINVEITMKDEQEADKALVSALEAPSPTAEIASSTTVATTAALTPNTSATAMAPAYPAGAGVGPTGLAQTAGLLGAGVGPGYGDLGSGIGGVGPGYDGIGPGFGGIGAGFDGIGPEFAGDVPFGPGFGYGPLFGLGYPFYVEDVVIVDDDHHGRRRHDRHDNDDDRNNDDSNNDDNNRHHNR